MKTYDIYNADTLRNWGWDKQIHEGSYAFARPARYPSIWNRLKLAWLILRGKIDGLEWTNQ